jgi:hypothetical protein
MKSYGSSETDNSLFSDIPSLKVSADSITWLRSGTGVILKDDRRSPGLEIWLQKNHREILKEYLGFERGINWRLDIHSKSSRAIALFESGRKASKRGADRSNDPFLICLKEVIPSEPLPMPWFDFLRDPGKDQGWNIFHQTQSIIDHILKSQRGQLKSSPGPQRGAGSEIVRLLALLRFAH